MKDIIEQLKQLPEEFVIEMERQKHDRWIDTYNFLIKYFNCEHEINEVEAEGFPIKDLFRKIHDIGFYGGINFALDPQIPYEQKTEE